MVMHSLREGAFGGFMKYILMSLLALSVLGLVFMDVGNVLKNNVGSTDVARVGSYNISYKKFDKIARLTLSRYNMTPQQAYEQNFLTDILTNEIRATYMLLEAKALGIKISKKNMQKKIAELVNPSRQEGQTLQQTLDLILRSQGIRENEFVDNIYREMVADLITQSVQAGFDKSTPESMAKDMFLFQNQTRDLEFVAFEEDEIKDVQKPDEERLKSLYDAYKNSKYKIPELRKFDIAYIDDTKIKDKIDISEEKISKTYDENIDEYKVSEQRVLEQAIAKTKDAAEQIFKLATDKGLSIEKAAKKVMGKKALYVPPSPFREDTLMEVIRQPVMDAAKGDIIGPFKSPIGFHIIKVKEIIPPGTKSYDQVKDSIRKDLLEAEISDRVYDLSTEFDDMLAGGASFDEVNNEIPLNIISLPAMSSTGLDKDQKNDVFEKSSLKTASQDKKDKPVILEEGFALQDAEISRVIEMPSGRFAAIFAKEVIEPSFKPFEEVKREIADQFIKDQQRAKNQEMVSAYKQELSSGKTSLAKIAKNSGKKVRKVKKLSLISEASPPLQEDHKPIIFQAKIGEYVNLPTESGMILAHITGFSLPEITKDSQPAIDKIFKVLGNESKDEVFAYYLYFLGDKYPAQINYSLLRQIYGSSEDGQDGS